MQIIYLKEEREIQMSKNEQRISIDVDKDLWHEVGVQSAVQGVLKKEYLRQALEEKIEKDKKGYEII